MQGTGILAVGGDADCRRSRLPHAERGLGRLAEPLKLLRIGRRG